MPEIIYFHIIHTYLLYILHITYYIFIYGTTSHFQHKIPFNMNLYDGPWTGHSFLDLYKILFVRGLRTLTTSVEYFISYQIDNIYNLIFYHLIILSCIFIPCIFLYFSANSLFALPNNEPFVHVLDKDFHESTENLSTLALRESCGHKSKLFDIIFHFNFHNFLVYFW